MFSSKVTSFKVYSAPGYLVISTETQQTIDRTRWKVGQRSEDLNLLAGEFNSFNPWEVFLKQSYLYVLPGVSAHFFFKASLLFISISSPHLSLSPLLLPPSPSPSSSSFLSFLFSLSQINLELLGETSMILPKSKRFYIFSPYEWTSVQS